MRRLIATVMATLAVAAPPCALMATARGDVVIYSNVTTFTGFGVTNGGATGTATTELITTMVAEKIVPAAGTAATNVDSFEFSLINFNAAAVAFRPIVNIYATNGAGGGPGSFLAGFAFNPITVAGLTGELVSTGISPTTLFTTPAGGFWVGLIFDNNFTGGGATGITPNQINNVGQLTFAPPTIGTSPDLLFASNGTGLFQANNPAGVLVSSPFGGAPVANFAWQFSGTPATSFVAEPPPSLLGGAFVAIMCLMAALRARRRRAAM